MVILFGFCVLCINPSLQNIFRRNFGSLFKLHEGSCAYWHDCVTAPHSVAGAQIWQEFNTYSYYLLMVWSGWFGIPSMSATFDSSVFGTIPSLAPIYVFFISGCHQLFRSYFQHFESSHNIFLQLKQNLLQTHYSFKSATFQVCQNYKWNNTHLYLSRHYSAVACITALFQVEMTQKRLSVLCLVVEVCAGINSVSLQCLITPCIHLIWNIV